MSRAYIRVDPGFYERKALRQGYPLGAVAALIGCLCVAETQPQRGRFRDRKVLRVLLGPGSRWIDFLIEHGDLSEQVADSGKQGASHELYIEGWDEWQEGDVTPPARMAAIARRRGESVQVTPGAIRMRRFRERQGRHMEPTSDASPDADHVTRHAVEAEAVSGSNSGGGVTPSRPTTFMGYRPRRPEPPPLPGEAAVVRHDGQHADCSICSAVGGAGDIEQQHAASLAEAIARTKEREAAQ